MVNSSDEEKNFFSVIKNLNRVNFKSIYIYIFRDPQIHYQYEKWKNSNSFCLKTDYVENICKQFILQISLSPFTIALITIIRRKIIGLLSSWCRWIVKFDWLHKENRWLPIWGICAYLNKNAGFMRIFRRLSYQKLKLLSLFFLFNRENLLNNYE